MIETKVADIDGKDVIYKQCTTDEEQQKLPSGLSGYWEYDGKHIYSPGELTNLVVKHAASGNMQIQALTDPKVVQNHYKQLRQVQQDSVQKHYAKMIEEYRNNPNISPLIKDAAIKQMEYTKQFFNNPKVYPKQDGTFVPTTEQAEELLGKHTVSNMPKEVEG